MRLVMHSYTFRAYPLEEVFRNAQRFGWQGIELQPCHFSPLNLAEELPRAIEMGARYGIPIYCVDFDADFIVGDSRAVASSVAALKRQIDICAENGVAMMNGAAGWLRQYDDWSKNGSKLAKPEHYERAAAALREAGAHAASRGVTLALEIHMNTIHDTAASCAKLLDMAGAKNVVANPDPGNMFSTDPADRDPDTLDQLAGRIGYVHLKNCVAVGGGYSYSVKLADGYLDIYQIIQKLCDLDYEGAICVEYCGEGDPHVAAEEDIAYVRRCLEWVRRT